MNRPSILCMFCVVCCGAATAIATSTMATEATASAYTTSIASTAATTTAVGTGTTAPTTMTTAVGTGTTAPTTMTTAVGTGTTAPTTMTTAVGTETTAPTTNSTENATVPTTGLATTVTPEPPAPRFRVNNSDGETCMLLNFNATMKVKYDTTDKGLVEATIPVANTTSYEGFCNSSTLRNFTLYYPDQNLPCAELVLFFNATSKTTYYNRQGIYVRYIDPCFGPDAVKFNDIDGGHYPPSYDGTIGKSFKCDSVACYSKTGRFTVILDNILIQPFAEKSADKGHYGKVETCAPPLLTTKHPHSPKPTNAPNNAGMIAGIVIGVLAFVAIVIGVAVFVVRKRRLKTVAYGNL